MVELIRYKYSGHDWVTWAKGDAIYSCDNCYNFFSSAVSQQEQRRKRGNSLDKVDVCKTCSIITSKKKLVSAGTKYLKGRTDVLKKEHAKIGGIASSKVENLGRFNSERWHNMSKDQQTKQVKKASKALYEKLNKNPEAKREHFKKVHAQKGIGYISKGHKELHQSISHLGFETHVLLDSMEVDECNKELKIVVEYNGDYWHCNPRKYSKDYYNKAIKMTAGEKWRQDIARNKILEKLGYKVLTVWESDWVENRDKNINMIKDACNEINIKA